MPKSGTKPRCQKYTEPWIIACRMLGYPAGALWSFEI